MLISPITCPFLRYGHKCGRVEDTVVIVGGADERGDYLPSTMLLNLVTREVSTKNIARIANAVTITLYSRVTM